MQWSPDRQIHLAGPPEFTSTCVLPALAGLVRDGLNLHVTLGRPAEQLLALLAAGVLDTVVSTIAPGDEAVGRTPLFEEEFVLVAAAGVRADIDPDQLQRGPAALAGLPLIAYAEDLPIVRRYWRAAFGVPPASKPAVVVPDLRAVLAMTVAGAGVTVLPSYLCRRELASGKLVALLEPFPSPANTIYLASGAKSNTAEVKAVTECLVAHAHLW